MEQTIDFKDRFSMLKFVATADIFTNGQKVKQFESDWNDWLGSKYSLFVSSGSTANFLLIASIKEKYGLKDGDKVLLPACTWMTNVAPVIQLGLEPVFCDINLSDFSFNKSHMQDIAKQHPDIKMIFVTHLLGFAADNKIYSEIFPEAIILDDVCESHGAKFSNGSKVGSDSLGATFSFYFGHHMTTIEGGMVSTNDKELYDLMKMKRSHGMARESVDFDKYADKYPDINKSFLFITDGYNFRNHEVCAVLGISQLKKLDKSINKRRENYSMFHSVIRKYPDLFYIPDHQDGNSSFCFPIICSNKEVFNKLKDKMIDNGIEFRPIVGGNLLKHPFLSEYKLAPSFDNNYVVDIVEQNGLYVGNSQFINKNHIELLDKIFMEIL
jgi:CDP-6-deoxy-D-xylo-4-hexulose-3-dehydrase